jgi:hypothetical protein
VSQKEFAEYIGIYDKNFNHFYTGRRLPKKELIEHLASFFEDFRFYDAVNLPRPDEELIYIQTMWGKLPKQIREDMFEEARKYITDNYVIEKEKKK